MIKLLGNIIRFSVADADYYFKEILISTLLNNPFYQLINNCNNGHELIKQAYARQEDIFFIDLYMPVISGIEAIKYIRARDTHTPIVTYSSTYQEDVAKMLIEFPSTFYCEKKTIIIQDLLKNYILSPLKKYDNYLNEWKKQPNAVNEYIERQRKAWYTPSTIEIQLMKLSYEGLSNKEMGVYLNLSSRTIDTYIKRLTEKLGLRNKIDLIRFSVEHGYYNSSS